MNTVTPIITPVPVKPVLCPSCGKPESIKRICRHCGHEYHYSPVSNLTLTVIILCVAAGIYVFFTVAYWLLEQDLTHPTLLDVLKIQASFFSNLRIW